jgi:hypothetical protein
MKRGRALPATPRAVAAAARAAVRAQQAAAIDKVGVYKLYKFANPVDP